MKTTKVTYKQLNVVEVQNIYHDLLQQCLGISWIEKAFMYAWDSFKTESWKYDGATFVREHNGNFWEVAAFIHDAMNHEGYVGKGVDLFFIRVMIELNYGERIIFERCKWMQWTWINVWRHKLKGNFKGNLIPGEL